VLRNSPYSGNLLSGTGRVIDLRKVAPALPAVLGGNKTPVIDWTQLDFGSTPHIEAYHDYLWREHGVPERYKYAGDVVKYMRRLSLRECAALQGLPPGHPFRGPAVTQFKLAGTAVPPALGEAVGRAVLAGLS
jgi:DNA (cytosine-5)-methyltransferase 1